MTDRDTRRRHLEERYILDFAMLPATKKRRDEILAIWAADKLGRNDPGTYIDEVRLAGCEGLGDNGVLRKILADLRSKGLSPTENELRRTMNELMFEAAESLEKEKGDTERKTNAHLSNKSASPSVGAPAAVENSVGEILRPLRSSLAAVPVLGILIAFTASHGGFGDLYDLSLIVSTAVVAIALILQIATSLGRREFGLDVIAFLSMSSALVFGEYLAAAVVALMYSGGQFLESIAEGRARREMTALLTRAPRSALRRHNGSLEEISVEDIQAGDRLVVRMGDVVATDGTLESDATLDESPLTGEAFPVNRKAGRPVLSGCSNAGELFEFTATKAAAESTYAGIIKLVEAAHKSKAPMSRLADRYALAFLLVTLLIAGLAWLQTGDPIRAVSVLVVATPCPLILAVPIAWTAGMSRAASVGLLLKGARVLELLGQVRTMVFDKTGTLTDGQPHLAVIESSRDDNEVLGLVASLDQASTHVAAQALVREARDRGLTLSAPTNVTENPGEGISGYVEGKHVAVGGLKFIASRFGQVPKLDRPGLMTAAVAIDGRFAATLVFRDALREGATEALETLRRLGLNRIILATGDRADVARTIAADLPLDEVHAELTPAQKIGLVTREAALATTMMVGDGINDAPALAAADIGLAMGTRGSAAAVEAGDAVLLIDRLDRICLGVTISRRCRRIAMQSIVAGIGLSVLGMMIAAFGYLEPVEGALVQEAIDVAVVINALRALRTDRAGDMHQNLVGYSQRRYVGSVPSVG